MSLNKVQIALIARKIYKQFPELKGAEPDVRSQSTHTKASGSANGQGRAKSSASKPKDERYLLTFKGNAALPNGRKMLRVVRVTADGRGKVLKVTTSR